VPSLRITKCQAAGNDFVLLDGLDGDDSPGLDYALLARFLCARRQGVGADGLLVLLPASGADSDVALRVFNADGSEAQMCGNGMRCVAKYFATPQRGGRTNLRVQTATRPVATRLDRQDGVERITVTMGVPDFTLAQAPPGTGTPAPFGVSFGNPHYVVFTDDELASFDLAALAARINAGVPAERHANVEVARGRGAALSMRVWERGVGETPACGSGACAVAVCALSSGRATSPLSVAMQGGRVEVRWDGPGRPAYLTGDAVLTFSAHVELPAQALSAAAAAALPAGA
jgi:diaminopimelate epimerase